MGSLFKTACSGAALCAASDRTRKAIFHGYIYTALAAFAVLAWAASTTAYSKFDLLVTHELQSRLPDSTFWVMAAVSWPGFMGPSTSIVLFCVIILIVLELRWEAQSVLFAACSSGSLNYLLKIAIRRPRPATTLVIVFNPLDSYSFPSGHVMFYVAFFGFLVYLVLFLFKDSIRRSLFISFLVFLISAVGFSRLYLGDHWASDVIGGYLLGSLVLITSIRFYHWGRQRVVKGQPAALESEELDAHYIDQPAG